MKKNWALRLPRGENCVPCAYTWALRLPSTGDHGDSPPTKALRLPRVENLELVPMFWL